jgi:phage recombination protein Bet
MSTAVAKKETTSVVSTMAARYGTDSGKLLQCLKDTVFRDAKNESQLMALCLVANEYGLNPLTKEIYAFPDSKSGGIIPVVGVDGWARIINQHPQLEAIEYDYDNEGEWVECIITRKDRSKPLRVREYMSECIRIPAKDKPPTPWQTHPMRMLRHKATIQAARLAFGFAGIKDPDEAERIIEAVDAESKPAFRPVRKKQIAEIEQESIDVESVEVADDVEELM